MKNFQGDFVNGKISAREYRNGVKKSGLFAGFLYGCFMSIFFVLLGLVHLNKTRSFQGMIFSSIIGGIIGGLLFGFFMYLWMISIVNKTIKTVAEKPVLVVDSDIQNTNYCSICGSQDMSIITWKNLMMLHWILNPGLVFNELILGQRVPSEMHKCKKCGNYFVECHHCNSLINSNELNRKKAFFQWEGLRCPKCNSKIPCLRNAFAGLILIITKPLWWPISKLVTKRSGN